MSKTAKQRTGQLAFLLVLVSLLLGCRQPVEGCLDFRALTVAIAADDPCDACCVYPALGLNFIPARLDSGADTILEVLTRTTLFVRAAGDTVVFERLFYYLSDLALVRADGSEVALLDTFGFRQNASDPRVLQEASLLRIAPLQTPRAVTGQLLEEGNFIALRGRFGISTTYATARPEALRGGNRFQLGQDSGLYDFREQRYRSAYLRRRSSFSGIDSVTVAAGTDVSFELSFPEEFLLERAYNLNIVIALPIEGLLGLPAGEVSAQQFVAALLEKARIVNTSASR